MNRHPSAAVRTAPLLCSVTLSLAACLASGTALAATAEAEAEAETRAIIVTGQDGGYKADDAATAMKLPLSLRDTPQSITVITRQQIEDFNLNTIADVLMQTPGVTISSLDSNRTSFNVRGFAVQNFQLDGVPTVFQTGAYANSALSDMSIYERVEVVRGAAGLVTGTGDPSATVNLIRKSPTRELAASANLTAGSWDYYRAEADIGGPITRGGGLRARLVGAYTDKHTQFDFQHDKSPSIYGVIEGDLTPTTVVRVGADYLETISDGGAWSAVPLYYSDGTPTDIRRSYSAAARWNRWQRDSLNLFGSVEQRIGSEWRAKFSYNRRTTDTDSLLFAGASGYPNRDGTGQGVWDYYGVTEQTEHAFDAYAAGPLTLFGRKHDIVIGANHYDRDFSVLHAGITDRQYSFDFPSIFTWDGNVPRPTTENLGIPNWTDHNRETGIYGAVRLNPADGVKLIGGVRYTDWQSHTDNFDRQGQPTTSTPRIKEERLTPYGGIIVDLTGTVSAFASYSSVFKPQSTRDRNNKQLSPVVGGNYEAGLKAEFFDKRLYMALNGFHMKQDNVAELDPDVPPNSLPDGSSAYRAVSGVKTWGGEFEVAGEVAPGWTLSGGYTYARSKNADGDRVFTNNPLHIARFYTTYRLPGALERLTIGGGIAWQSRIYQLATIPTGAFNGTSPVTRRANVGQGGYTLVNLMARYALTDHIQVGANISNLFDTSYYRNVGFYNAGYYGEPRRVMANLRFVM